MDFLKEFIKNNSIKIIKNFGSIENFIDFHNLYHWILLHKEDPYYSSLYTIIEKKYNIKKYRNLILAKEWQQIKEKLNSNSIKCWLIKGISISNQLFNDVCFRITRDIDIFVNFDSIEKVDSILNQCGYILIFPKKINFINTKTEKYFNELVYLNPSKKISIEVHLRFTVPELLFYKGEEIFKIIHDKELFIFYPLEWTLHYLIVHNAIHNWALLGNLSDISIVLKNNIDWQKFKLYPCYLKNLRMIKITFYLCRFFFNSEIPEEYLKLSFIEKTYVNILLNYHSKVKKSRSGIKGLKKIFTKLFLQKSLKYKFYFILTRLYRKVFLELKVIL